MLGYLERCAAHRAPDLAGELARERRGLVVERAPARQDDEGARHVRFDVELVADHLGAAVAHDPLAARAIVLCEGR